jgi:DDE family transposase
MAEMHAHASPPGDGWPAIAARLPADLDLDAVARETGAIQRRRGDGISDGATLLRLSLARGPGGKSLQETAGWAGQIGLAELTGQSLNERLHRSVAFLCAVTQRLLAARTGPPVVWSGRCLHLVDGSTVSRPGSKGTDWRIHAVYDLGRGGFRHLEVTDGHGAESLLRCAPATGEVAIADRGYAKARELRACLEAFGPQARDFIVRIGWSALVLRDAQGGPFNLIETLAGLPAQTRAHEWAVQVLGGSSPQAAPLALRLIALPLPADKAEANRLKLKRKASRDQQRLDPRSLIAAGFMVLVTSLPDDIPAGEICAVYRLRWQIELAFKRLKSLIHIDRLPTRTEPGSLSWLYAHLIAALLTDDMNQEILESFPSGPC